MYRPTATRTRERDYGRPPQYPSRAGREVAYLPRRREPAALDYNTRDRGSYRARPTSYYRDRPSPPRQPRDSREKWAKTGSKARVGIGTISKGYSRLRSLWGTAAFISGVLIALRRFDNVHGQLSGTDEECSHANVILDQLNALLRDPDVVSGLSHDRQGRQLLERITATRDDITATVHKLRMGISKYVPNEPDLMAKVEFLIRDSHKISGLREQLRQDLDYLQDLMVWVNR